MSMHTAASRLRSEDDLTNNDNKEKYHDIRR